MTFFISLWVGVMLTTSVLQFIGFFSPEWACNIDKSISEDYCEIKGLLYPSGGLDQDIIGLCATCLIGSVLLTFGIMVVFINGFKDDTLHWWFVSVEEKVASGFFLALQFLAGVACLICFVRYDVHGWSAVLFFTFAFPVFIVVVGIIFCCLAVVILFLLAKLLEFLGDLDDMEDEDEDEED